MKPQVVVVEGKNDEFRIKSLFPNLKVIVTNGAAIDQDALVLLDKLEETHEIILMLDPDHAGERIRRILSKKYKHVSHVFIKQENAKSSSGKKTGIEHANLDILKEALNGIRNTTQLPYTDITPIDLYDFGLTGHPMSATKRKKVCEQLNIGNPNGKTLYQRLAMFHIMKKDLKEAICESSS
jgi:ribonuclease M5